MRRKRRTIDELDTLLEERLVRLRAHRLGSLLINAWLSRAAVSSARASRLVCRNVAARMWLPGRWAMGVGPMGRWWR